MKHRFHDLSLELLKIINRVIMLNKTFHADKIPLPFSPLPLLPDASRNVGLRSREQELAQPLTSCSTLESRSWQHSRIDPVVRGEGKQALKG